MDVLAGINGFNETSAIKNILAYKMLEKYVRIFLMYNNCAYYNWTNLSEYKVVNYEVGNRLT